MTVRRTYLDWNATAPLLPGARAAMIAAMDVIGNPSSVHAEGRAARALIEDAREQVAALVGARAADVVFTSAATEANAMVAAETWDRIFVTDIEHDSVFPSARSAGDARVVKIPVDASGRMAAEDVGSLLASHTASGGRAIVSVQMANNETGVIQEVGAIASAARASGVLIHTDAVQAVGRVSVDVAALGVDYLALSAHKIGGPKGVGALVLRDGASLSPLIAGGGQERRRRAGTENVVAIAGFGAAARAAIENLAHIDDIARRRDHLEREMVARFDDVVVIGAGCSRLANTSCLAFRGRAAETLVIKYDLAGVSISAGAACSSGKVGASRVLSAMGLASDLARGAIRVSLGPTTTDSDIAAFLAASDTILRSAAKAA